jgi:hypothetical protein
MAAELGIDITGAEGTTIDELVILVSRLEQGERMIERYRQAGRDTASLEDHWIELLRDYESLYDSRCQRAA